MGLSTGENRNQEAGVSFIFVDYATWTAMQAAITRIDKNVTQIATTVSQMEKQMSALSDAVTAVSADLDALSTKLDTETTEIGKVIALLAARQSRRSGRRHRAAGHPHPRGHLVDHCRPARFDARRGVAPGGPCHPGGLTPQPIRGMNIRFISSSRCPSQT